MFECWGLCTPTSAAWVGVKPFLVRRLHRVFTTVVTFGLVAGSASTEKTQYGVAFGASQRKSYCDAGPVTALLFHRQRLLELRSRPLELVAGQMDGPQMEMAFRLLG